MSKSSKVPIVGLPTGVPGLDQIIGKGGLPEFSFNLIAGPPGSGKTTLAQQITFANAGVERPALFFTVMGEPPLKMLRYMQQYEFFDSEKIDKTIRFVNLAQEAMSHDLGRILDAITREVEAGQPGIVVVDSFRTVVRVANETTATGIGIAAMVQQLALHLASWQATTFLVGEYLDDEMRDNPVFTVADGVLWLRQTTDRNSVVRKLQVTKMRGRAPQPGLHTFRITDGGIQVFPRQLGEALSSLEWPRSSERRSTGIAALDEMMQGGMKGATSALIAGPAGSGKTTLATHFIDAGTKIGEPGVIAIFEEHPKAFIDRARSIGFDLEKAVNANQLKIIYLRPLDLSTDEALLQIRTAIDEIGAKRVVIDSLSGLELAIAPTFRDDFRDSLYRTISLLTSTGTSVMLTVEMMESFTDLSFTPHSVSFLTDVIIVQRYVELDGQLKKVLAVVKMRSSGHSHDLRAYHIGAKGLVIDEVVTGYRGVITGIPEPDRTSDYPGLTAVESRVLKTLTKMGKADLESLARTASLRTGDLPKVMDRLVLLNYAIEENIDGDIMYRLGLSA